jgi:hypothetical protein
MISSEVLKRSKPPADRGPEPPHSHGLRCVLDCADGDNVGTDGALWLTRPTIATRPARRLCWLWDCILRGQRDFVRNGKYRQSPSQAINLPGLSVACSASFCRAHKKEFPPAKSFLDRTPNPIAVEKRYPRRMRLDQLRWVDSCVGNTAALRGNIGSLQCRYPVREREHSGSLTTNRQLGFLGGTKLRITHPGM